MKILVTGTEGYLGCLLAPELLRDGHDVLGVDTGFYKAGWLYNGVDATPRTLVKDIRQLTAEDLEGVDAIVAMAELSNDPLGQLAPSPGERAVHLRLSSPDRSAALRLWDDLAAMQGWRRRLRFAWDNLCPSPAYMRRRYQLAHPLWLPLAYPYRWWRGLGAWLRSARRP